MAQVDVHKISQAEYDEIPELTDEMVERAEFHVGDRFVRRGPPGTADDRASIGLMPEIADHFRAGGPGWQARVNRILLEVVARERAKA